MAFLGTSAQNQNYDTKQLNSKYVVVFIASMVCLEDDARVDQHWKYLDKTMAIYIENKDMLDQMFNACSTEQIAEFASQKRSFRIHGHSTTIRLERAFWNVLEFIAENRSVSLPILIEVIHDQCIVANDKNLASCLRVICLKYVNIYTD